MGGEEQLYQKSLCPTFYLAAAAATAATAAAAAAAALATVIVAKLW